MCVLAHEARTNTSRFDVFSNFGVNVAGFIHRLGNQKQQQHTVP